MPGMPTLTAGRGMGAEVPRSLAQACWQGHLHHRDLTRCKMTVLCPVTVIQASLLKRKPRFQKGVWEFLSTLAEHIGEPVSHPSWG